MAVTIQNHLATNIPFLTGHKSGDSNLSRGNIYSTFSLLPIILVLTIVLGVYTFCKLRRWREDKKQIVHLATFYDSIEHSNLCEKSGFPTKVLFNNENNISTNEKECDRIRRALMIPIGSSPFYQPVGTYKAYQTSLPAPIRPFINRKV